MATLISINVYDLTNGLASQYAPMLIGKSIEGIWHTGIIYGTTEYYYSSGICSDYMGSTPYGTPKTNVQIGTTTKSVSEFIHFLNSIQGEFTMEKYHIFYHNCNTFTNEASKFLTGKTIPEYILNQHLQLLNTSLGKFLEPFINQMFTTVQGNSHSLKMEEDVQFNNELDCEEDLSTVIERNKGAILYFHCSKCEGCSKYARKYNSLFEQNDCSDFLFAAVNIDTINAKNLGVSVHPTICAFFEGKVQDTPKMIDFDAPESEMDGMVELIKCLIESLPTYKVFKPSKEPYLYVSTDQKGKMAEAIKALIANNKLDAPYLMNHLINELEYTPNKLTIEDAFALLGKVPILNRICLYDAIRTFLLSPVSYRVITIEKVKDVGNEVDSVMKFVGDQKEVVCNSVIMFLRMCCNLFKYSSI